MGLRHLYMLYLWLWDIYDFETLIMILGHLWFFNIVNETQGGIYEQCTFQNLPKMHHTSPSWICNRLIAWVILYIHKMMLQSISTLNWDKTTLSWDKTSKHYHLHYWNFAHLVNKNMVFHITEDSKCSNE